MEVAEKLCSKPSECLTTLIVNDPFEVVSKMRQPQYARFQVNIMMIATKSLDSTLVIPIYCPAFATKFKIVNAWNPVKSSLLFQQTETKCGHPLTGNFLHPMFRFITMLI